VRRARLLDPERPRRRVGDRCVLYTSAYLVRGKACFAFCTCVECARGANTDNILREDRAATLVRAVFASRWLGTCVSIMLVIGVFDANYRSISACAPLAGLYPTSNWRDESYVAFKSNGNGRVCACN
jgi:hypothetical protein